MNLTLWNGLSMDDLSIAFDPPYLITTFYFLLFHSSTMPFRSKKILNSLNSFYKSTSILVNSIKLKEDLQPTLGSLGQIMVTNLFVFKL
jgi:hypothetical protein